ncbi:hypothetical protein A3D78_01390 [Candidatus Gottesmanbacteria bacterium RIFCSPHIGHO2_02_FULL_39_14]|uniref:Uncharacterized protein n=1 Tax=Candidatus Gottesmanbacteria bacterium RIFCSPHIGHO2_02_FULL_39_14 TaxID=1798383 RepID=A0A1F5ZU91_9BACT|nr:MAG: hypothetical protein A3D78_01390 [Candidatus Gottesmanbacteria bacterium RIFCSPHIGHO2_02_FULL_39_14]
MDTKSELQQQLTPAERKELIALPALVIRPHTAEEEFEYLRYVLDNVSFSRQHGYSFEIPDNHEFKKLAELSPNFDGVDWDHTKSLFKDQLYDPSFYNAGLQALENERPRIEKAFPSFLQFNKNWGFKVYPMYDLALTRYGRGGTSYEDTGKIIMLTRRDGTFKRKHPSHTPIHEMVELGIKQLALQYKLTQGERERFVDHLCISGLGDLVPEYKFQTDDPDLSQVGDKNVDPFFSDKSLINLTDALNKYVSRYPRE